jgi:hypothetical protein
MKGLMEMFGMNALIWRCSIMWIMQGRWPGYFKNITTRNDCIAVWDIKRLKKLQQNMALRQPIIPLGKLNPFELKHLGKNIFAEVRNWYNQTFENPSIQKIIMNASKDILLENSLKSSNRNDATEYPWPKNGWKNCKILKITVDLKMGTRQTLYF